MLLFLTFFIRFKCKATFKHDRLEENCQCEECNQEEANSDHL